MSLAIFLILLHNWPVQAIVRVLVCVCAYVNTYMRVCVRERVKRSA
jgi:hypothetical protein